MTMHVYACIKECSHSMMTGVMIGLKSFQLQGSRTFCDLEGIWGS